MLLGSATPGHPAGTAEHTVIALVDVGRVDEVDPQVDRFVDEPDGIGFGNGSAESHRAQADRGNQQAAGSEVAEFHGVDSLAVGAGVSQGSGMLPV